MQTLPDVRMLPQRVLAQPGAITGLLGECQPFGARGLLVHGHSLLGRGVLERILAGRPDTLNVTTWTHPGGEPTLDQVEDALVTARTAGVEWVAAVGGGSVMDVGKACAGLLEAPLPVAAYHDGAPIPPSRVPFIAAPTTAGTGAEATTVTVLTDTLKGVKKSFRHPTFLPRVVILDPQLLECCPPQVMAWSGMDAFTQALEAYVSKGATAFSDALALDALRQINGNLVAGRIGATGAVAQALLEGSFIAGVAFSHARLGLVHGLAHPLGLRWHAAHGLVCAICLPPVLEFNRPVISEKYAAVSAMLGKDLSSRVTELLSELQIESPFRGQALRDRDAIIDETLASGSTAANPRDVTAADVSTMLDVLFAAG